jgi:AcrR family transcriptional regulator
VTETTQAPSGLSRRRRRLPDDETERRMLDTAVQMVNEAGLTVSLEHISYEDVIRDARVSRSTAYRRWPYKDLFFSDLLKELARAATPAAVSSEATSIPLIRQIIMDHRDWLATPELRDELLLELIRQGSEHDFLTMYGSTEWRTYLALHATFLSVADEKLRHDLEAALAASERDFVDRVAAAWQLLAELLGYRLRPEPGGSYESFARIAVASLRGQVLMALSDPDLGRREIHGRPFGRRSDAAWSPSGFSLASLAMACFEPDPDVVWDEARIGRVLAAIDRLAAVEPAP